MCPEGKTGVCCETDVQPSVAEVLFTDAAYIEQLPVGTCRVFGNIISTFDQRTYKASLLVLFHSSLGIPTTTRTSVQLRSVDDGRFR